MSYQILLVDDDIDFREELRESLMDNYRVSEAGSGEEALKIIGRPNSIDLVILDVGLPGLSGIETLIAIKSIDPSLPIIILTGQSSKDVAVDALKGRADDYIEKPFNMDQFLRIIDKMVSRGKGPLEALKDRNKMELVKKFIERNSSKKVSLKDAAQEVSLSLKYLSRVFKEKNGQGFNEYRLKLKMDKAMELLRSRATTVSEIAFQLGYKNPESFVRIFKKKTGATPAEYRRKHAKRKT